jgi:hypothetical protein
MQTAKLRTSLKKSKKSNGWLHGQQKHGYAPDGR